jgi:hypothetical protein
MALSSTTKAILGGLLTGTIGSGCLLAAMQGDLALTIALFAAFAISALKTAPRFEWKGRES